MFVVDVDILSFLIEDSQRLARMLVYPYVGENIETLKG